MEKSSKAPRGRPRAFDRGAALSAATELFWLKGFSATSIADLCEAMGVTPPSLYAAFGNKEKLYAEAIAHYEDSNAECIWGPTASASSARAAIEIFLMASAAALTRPERPRGCMVVLSAAREEGCAVLGALVGERRAEAYAGLHALIARGVAAGELPASVDAEQLARFALCVQQGMSIQARDGASREQLESVAQAAMAAWDGLAGAHPNERPPASGDGGA